MPIYDNNGTTTTEIRSIYDNNGSVNTQIGKVYDNNGTTSSLIYSAEEQIYPGVSATPRVYSDNAGAGTFYAIAGKHNKYANGACAYITIGANSYSKITMTCVVNYVPQYGAVMFGVGNFATYDLSGLGPSLSVSSGDISTKNCSPGQQFTLTFTGAQAAQGQVGVAAYYRSSAGSDGRIDVVSIIAQ